MCTYLTEIESIINGRSVTPLSYSINDFEALTPNHFLTGTANPNYCLVEKPGDIANEEIGRLLKFHRRDSGKDGNVNIYPSSRHVKNETLVISLSEITRRSKRKNQQGHTSIRTYLDLTVY